MDRKEYLERCQRCAVLPKDGRNTRIDVPEELLVDSDGISFYPFAYTMRFDERGNTIHIAVLHDLKTACIKEDFLEKVTDWRDSQNA